MPYSLPYPRQNDALHEISHLCSLSDEASEVILVSARTLSILADYARHEVNQRHHYTSSLSRGAYQSYDATDAQYQSVKEIIAHFQLEVVPITQEVIDALIAIHIAIENLRNRM